MSLDYGPIEWKDDYDAKITSGALDGRRWRFGKDHWTNLDTSVDLTFGEVKVPAGHYYLTLERKSGGAYAIAFHDPSKVRSMRIDPVMAESVKGGIEVPLRHAVTDAGGA